jgi:pimeloyl-ACP methyl ester carboxylesterase
LVADYRDRWRAKLLATTKYYTVTSPHYGLRVREEAAMATFALVHGAWHGGWCWDRLIPELQARGHRAVAVDLPTEDWSAGCAEYAAIVLDALRDADEDVVVVGHSLGGLTIPLIAAARPVQRLVFLCALLPQPGCSLAAQPAEDPGAMQPDFGAAQIVHPDGSTSWPEDAAIEKFYHDCAPEDAHWAAARLRRQTWKPTDQVTPLATWPPIPSTYILCTEDRAIVPAWSRQIARTRLGGEAVEFPGGHSPFLSRPAELAAILTSL